MSSLLSNINPIFIKKINNWRFIHSLNPIAASRRHKKLLYPKYDCYTGYSSIYLICLGYKLSPNNFGLKYLDGH